MAAQSYFRVLVPRTHLTVPPLFLTCWFCLKILMGQVRLACSSQGLRRVENQTRERLQSQATEKVKSCHGALVCTRCGVGKVRWCSTVDRDTRINRTVLSGKSWHFVRKYSSRNVTMHSDNIIHRSTEAASTLGFLVIAWTVLRCPILIRAQVTDF